METSANFQAREYDKLLRVIEQIYEIEHPRDLSQITLLAVKELVSSDYVHITEIPRLTLHPKKNGLAPLINVISYTSTPISNQQALLVSKFLHQHPSSTYFKKTQDGRPYKFSDFLNKKQFHQLDLYNEYFRPMGIEHQIHFILNINDENLIVPLGEWEKNPRL